jgi:hypothetical protein
MFLKTENRASLFLCSICIMIFCCSVAWAGEANQSVSHRTKVPSTIKETLPIALPDSLSPDTNNSGATLLVKMTPDEYELCPPRKKYWIEYSLSSKEWDWRVRKPGIYASKCLTGTIKSSVDVLVDFNGFEDLCPVVKPAAKLETYYAASVSPLALAQVQWLRASNFNNGDLLIKANATTPTPWYLWNKISVNGSTSAGKYTDAAVITFVMQNVQLWLDLGP